MFSQQKLLNLKFLNLATAHARWDAQVLKRNKALIRNDREKKILHEVNDIETHQLALCMVNPITQKIIIGFAENAEAKRRKAMEQRKAALLAAQQQHKSGTSALIAQPGAQNLPRVTFQNTERIDHMITNIGGWNALPPPPNSTLDANLSLSKVKPIYTNNNNNNNNTSTTNNNTSSGVIESKRLQQNASLQNKKKQNEAQRDPGDEPIPAAAPKKPAAEPRPFEPIPPILM
eukprot:UN02537